MLVLWPISTSLGPLIAFVIINGAANGGFFATIPTVVGSVFRECQSQCGYGNDRVGLGRWISISEYSLLAKAPPLFPLTRLGCSNCWILVKCIWRRGSRH